MQGHCPRTCWRHVGNWENRPWPPLEKHILSTALPETLASPGCCGLARSPSCSIMKKNKILHGSRETGWSSQGKSCGDVAEHAEPPQPYCQQRQRGSSECCGRLQRVKRRDLGTPYTVMPAAPRRFYGIALPQDMVKPLRHLNSPGLRHTVWCKQTFWADNRSIQPYIKISYVKQW